MYNLIACPQCKHSEEIELIDMIGFKSIYICHNENSSEYGILHAEFFECRLSEHEKKRCDHEGSD